MYQLRLLDYGSPDHEEMVQLRQAVLRSPLGLTFTPEYLKKEAWDWLIGIFDHPEGGSPVLAGCCILSPTLEGGIQLRQMAVLESYRSKGLGNSILLYAEQKAREAGFFSIVLHARKPVVSFYEKHGYQVGGKEFLEVGIPHLQMTKTMVSP